MTKDNENNASSESSDVKKPEIITSEPEPVVSNGQISLNGQTLSYTATTGRLPVKNDKGEIEAHLFFTAYTRTDDSKTANRPLTIAFNGGPGSSSVWLHMGALGPKLAAMNPDGSLPPPPYTVADNPFTWLDETDLLFIDPPGTGYSRAKDEETARKFYGVDGDIQVLGEFIRLYLTRFQRWHSPLFLAGESYGTTRAAGIAGYLTEKGIVFRGIILISTVLNFQTIVFGPGNDLPYALFLPTYAATAWYHGKLSDSWQNRPLSELLQESEAFAEGEYVSTLMKGDRLTAEDKERISLRISGLTGISPDYIKRSDLRIPPHLFRKELRRDEGILVGRLDSRLTGREGRGNAEAGEYDPAMSAIRPPYTTVFNAYVRDSLKFETDLPYEILGGLYASWDWGKNNHYTDTANALRSALVKNPHLRVLNAAGYYDLATPHFAAEYTFSHLELDPALRENIEFVYYESGHMMYIEDNSLAKLKKDVSAFLLG